eukprot:TRINITY_DN4782_c0_g1_i1.p1 TRINITY_DN4782_c0_g1~~TRINITY_DN4782_c0_g1_i1.p1  ORF type:complete len:255 (+),score=55.59 TRINITY_DN4782_c0_g1_i1:871-1635(+)
MVPKSVKDAELSSNPPASETGIILGVTNPIFRKEFEHWPHLLIISKGKEVKTNKDNKSDKPEKTSGLLSKYKSIHQPDDKFAKQLGKKGVDDVTTSDNHLLCQQLYQETSNFISPLESYFYSTSPKDVSIFSDKIPTVPTFKEASFLKYLIKLGMKPKQIDFYRRFIRTPNFFRWFRTKKREKEREILANYIAALQNPSVYKNKSQNELFDIGAKTQNIIAYLEKKGELLEEIPKLLKYLEIVSNQIIDKQNNV